MPPKRLLFTIWVSMNITSHLKKGEFLALTLPDSAARRPTSAIKAASLVSAAVAM